MIAKRMPTFGNFAKNRGESAYPHLWEGLVYGWSPFLGPQPAGIKGRAVSNSALRTTFQAVSLNLTSGWSDTAGNPLGNAPSFNGTSQFGQSALSLDLTGTAKLTVCCWYRWTTNANDDDLLLESSTNANSNQHAITFNPNDSIQALFTIRIRSAAGANNNVKFARPTAGVWHHLMVVMDRGAGAAQIIGVWVDGIPQALTQITADTTSGTFGNFTWYFMSRGGASLFGAGNLGDVWLYAHNQFGNKEAQLFYAGASPLSRLPVAVQPHIMRRRFWSVAAGIYRYPVLVARPHEQLIYE